MTNSKSQSNDFLEEIQTKFSDYNEIVFLINIVTQDESSQVFVRNKKEEMDITFLFQEAIIGEDILEKFKIFSNEFYGCDFDLKNTGIMMFIKLDQLLSKKSPIEPVIIMHDYSDKNTYILNKEGLLEVDKNNQKRLHKKN